MSAEGERLFARYAFSPNDLGYCGPADASALFELAATGRGPGDVASIARRFSGAWPYLAVLAELAGCADPLDATLVRGYWTGAAVAGVDPAEFGARLLSRLGDQAGAYWRHLDRALLPEAAPDHGFHVFAVYPWSRMLVPGPSEAPLRVLESCRIGWGRVVSTRDDHVVVAHRPLQWDGERLDLGPEREHPVRHRVDGRGFVDDPRPGQWLALHWDWVCDRLTGDDVARLHRDTVARLALTNERLSRAGSPRAAAAAPARQEAHMGRPSIAQADEQIGFHWLDDAGRPVSLADLVRTDDEPERLPPTHLSALDDALIDAAGRFGRLLGGGEPAVTETHRLDLRELHRVLDRLCHEYAAALSALGLVAERRAGLVVGTAQLIAIRARMALGVSGPAPLSGTLSDPGVGVVSGHGRLAVVDPAAPWRGARWVVESEQGRRLPLTLSMLLFDSSGVNKEAARDEHRAALRDVCAAAGDADADPVVLAGAVEWLLYDWLMAHRESASSGALELRGEPVEESRLIVAAADALARARTHLDPTLFAVPTVR